MNKNLGYRGSQTKTNKGVMCIPWSDPVNTKYTTKKYPDADMRENFCRNPGKSGRTAWCYTSSETRRKWGYCNEVTKGETEGLWGPKGAMYRGKQTKTRNGLTCMAWDQQTPHKHGNTAAKKP